MKLKKGQEIYIKVTVVSQARDDRPANLKGYIVKTNRGDTAYIEPTDILVPLEEIK